LLGSQEISKLAPYSGLILTLSLVFFFLVRYYIFEGFLLQRFYGDVYTKLNENRRRGFINHHVAATAKIVMIITGAYPFFSVLAGSAPTLHHPFAGSKIVTVGDSECSKVKRIDWSLIHASTTRSKQCFHRNVCL
jgi:hypothetical protein